MNFVFQPWQLLVLILVGWVSRQQQEVIEYLQRVVEKEGLKIQLDAYDALVYIASGDMRKATNLLQTAAMDTEECGLYQKFLRALGLVYIEHQARN